MDALPFSPLFRPPPVPRTTPPGRLEVVRTIYRNPLELWGEPSYTTSPGFRRCFSTSAW